MIVRMMRGQSHSPNTNNKIAAMVIVVESRDLGAVKQCTNRLLKSTYV
jgi:hypothetical protein